MGEILQGQTYVKFGDQDMDAYLYLDMPEGSRTYVKEDILQILEDNGITVGIIEANIEKIINSGCYRTEVKVAEGIRPVDGTDGRFEFMFNRFLDKKPVLDEDGSVDYWSLSVIENVEKGQVIACYIPPTPEKPGISVKGEQVPGRRGRELQPLKGKGFVRSDDSRTYTALIDGKIEYKNDRIYISNLYEGFEDVDVVSGNIEFRGDIVIHGNVESGVSIKATGSITIDGKVEGAHITAGKDIILRSGVQGCNKAYIKSCGNIYSKFIEMAKVEAKGMILTNAIINSTVLSEDTVILRGNKGLISGSSVKGVKGVEAVTVGTKAGVRTKVSAGASEDTYQRISALKKIIEEARLALAEAEICINELNYENSRRPVRIENDPRMMLWLRSRVRNISIINESQAELEALNAIVDKSKRAYVRVLEDGYPGSRIEIDDKSVELKEVLEGVEFRKRNHEIVMYSLIRDMSQAAE
ncbi:DUF342 domain-containing protein [Anaerobium acetethylicum]|uniref:Flagellar Assembly Protein A N-terminal region domain-containing protein n=1 Tax=Anaerobium acetethylicum TaxID=1619234 RepID=A0A1D3TXU5_9FIRM|nr:FapA family protein [Anaerobium acetethylicum]SCP99190.1 hypothetical protein SAMN05421730_103419 [Anaerobium acetethylicum]